MLVCIEDTKGVEIWINPLHVKMVKQARKKTEIVMALSSGLGNSVVKTDRPVEEVAMALNAAMPEWTPFIPDDEHGDDGAAAAVIAAG